METMPYPCSPLVIPFPTQHEENNYLLWSPQEQEVMIPLENQNMCDADADANPEFMDMLIQEANDFLFQDELLSNGDPLFAGFDQRLGGQENGSLLSIHEEIMEESIGCSSLSDLLVAGATEVESGDTATASAILSRLDDLIPGVPYRGCHRRAAAAVSPSDHLACYFARGLRSRLSAGARTECHHPAAAESRTAAYRLLQELSPFTKFAHFSANQAILEATADDPGVHVVDLTVGEGVQWASLLSDLARHGRKPFHLTAAAAAGEHPDAARWLSEFADSVGVPFRYSTLHLRSDEDLHAFAASAAGGPVVVSCDTTGKPYSALTELQQLLAGGSVVLNILRPKLVVLAEEELFRLDRRRHAPPPPFPEFFREALRHFAAVLDSLESCLRDGGYGGAWLGRLVEEAALAMGPSVEDAVARYGTMTGGAAGGAELEGFRACQVSGFNAAQGRMLAGLFSRGFGVVHEEGSLALCWNSRPLTSVSVWSPV